MKTATEDRSVVMRVIGSMGLIGRKESLDEGGCDRVYSGH